MIVAFFKRLTLNWGTRKDLDGQILPHIYWIRYTLDAFLLNIICDDARVAESIAEECGFWEYHFTGCRVYLTRLVRLIFPDVHSLVDNARDNLQLNHRRTLNQLNDRLHKIALAIIVHGADVGFEAVVIQNLVFTQELRFAISSGYDL